MKFRFARVALVLTILFYATHASTQQIGNSVPVSAGSDADRAMSEINSASDPPQKLALIDKFAAGPGHGDMAMVADELYVNYYLAQKQYDKAFAYGDKIFAIDPGIFQNPMHIIRPAPAKVDVETLLAYGERTQSILTAYRSSPAPSGVAADTW